MVNLENISTSSMNHTRITVKEEDILKLVLEFLRTRNLHVTMRTLEKESGVINCEYTDEILFLRELILDGDWDEVLLFAKPFEGLSGFESDKFKYIILKQKFLEMLSLKSHIVGKQVSESIEEVIKTLGALEKCCPTKEEYSNLCWLLTVPDLHERIEFKNWSLDNSRMSCFDKVVELLSKVLPMRKKFRRNKSLASRDRLLQLIIKGLFYESCVDYCQAIAIGNGEMDEQDIAIKNDLITGIPEDYSANLLSWIRSLNVNNFGIPFEQLAVEIVLERHRRPTQITQSLDVPKLPRKKDVDVEMIFRSLVDGSGLSEVSRATRDLTLSKELGQVTSGQTRPKGRIVNEIPDPAIKLPIPQSHTTFLRESAAPAVSQREERPVPHSNQNIHAAIPLSPQGVMYTSSKVQGVGQGTLHNIDIESNQNKTEVRVCGSTVMPHSFDKNATVRSRNTSMDIDGGDLSVKDMKERQRMDVMKKLENYERERKVIERELFDSHTKVHELTDIPVVTRESLTAEEHATPGERYMPTGAGARQLPPKDDYYDSLKRSKSNKSNRTPQSSQGAKPGMISTTQLGTIPAQVQPQVTSTPKHVGKSAKETPPPQISPVVRQQSNTSQPRDLYLRRSGSKDAITLTPRRSERFEVKQEAHKQEILTKATEDPEGGKENTPSTAAAAGNLRGVRKGPMINGVRRTLTSNPAQLPVGHDVPLSSDALEAEKPGLVPSEIKNANAFVPKAIPADESVAQVAERPPSQQESSAIRPLSFNPVCSLEDMQAVRAVAFHPYGNIFAVGANSKIFRICSTLDEDFTDSEVGGLPSPAVLFKRTKYHRGSIYCVAWSPGGDIIATGSNDKTIKLMSFNCDNFVQEGVETDLTIHNGTVRELAFIPSKPSVLISGGAGDGGIPITDCQTCQTVGQLRGHSGTVMAVYAGEGDLIATGATDNTLRLWDLRSQRCIDVVMVGESSPASVALSADGAYMATGQEDGCILLYDIAAGRTLQSFRLHQEDCRSVRFSTDSKYLLTGSYDNSMDILHINSSLDVALPKHYTVGSHQDKVIQCRWHPSVCSFLSSSADRTVMLWRESSN